jgi:AraC-like DNA-binding protein
MAMVYQKLRLSALDSVEIKRVVQSLHAYPVHYHETFCVSLIEQGVFLENTLMAPQGTMMLTNPDEVHNNTVFANLAYGITTFYISPDVFRKQGELITFPEKVVYDPVIFNQLQEVVRLHSSREGIGTVGMLTQTISNLACRHGVIGQVEPIRLPTELSEIQYQMQMQFSQKLLINDMAKQLKMSRFQFIRWFRRYAGITPYDYLLLYRVEQGKQMLAAGKPPVQAALDVGFYDQSHFANAFKRYVGVTPGIYQEACTIFQDSVK